MSKILLMTRYPKDKTSKEIEERKEFLETRRIIDGDDFDESSYPESDEDKYCYEPQVFSLREVYTFNRVDDNHICLRYMSGSAYVVKIDFFEFVDIYQRLTGIMIYIPEEEVVIEKTKEDE